jgi:hypothetical protein
LGWFFWILAALTPIISNLVENIYLKEFLLVLNAFLATLAAILYLWGFLKYFMTVFLNHRLYSNNYLLCSAYELNINKYFCNSTNKEKKF